MTQRADTGMGLCTGWKAIILTPTIGCQRWIHPVKSLLNDRVADWLNNGIILGELQISPIRETIVQMKRQTGWNPNAFTEIIEQQERGQGSEETRGALEYIQHIEMTELLAYTLTAAQLKA